MMLRLGHDARHKVNDHPVRNHHLLWDKALPEFVNATEFSPKTVSVEDFRRLCLTEDRDSQLYTCTLDAGGQASVKYLSGMPAVSNSCAPIGRFLGRDENHRWLPSQISLYNGPCFMVVRNGTIILPNGKVLRDTVYPSAGDKTTERLLDIDSPSIEATSLSATRLKYSENLPAIAFYSRWAKVYFHLISESLVQFHEIQSNNLGACMKQIAPAHVSSTQKKLEELLSPDLLSVDEQLIAVPAAIYTTVCRRHAVLGDAFRGAVQSIRGRVLENASCNVAPQKLLYVSRVGEGMRPLINEPEIEAIFKRHSFTSVKSQNFSLVEQAALFSKAKVIVGPHGAGLLNAAFSAPNAVLVEIRGLNRTGGSPDYNETYRKLSAIMGFNYGFYVVENQIESDAWHLPTDAAEQIASHLAHLI